MTRPSRIAAPVAVAFALAASLLVAAATGPTAAEPAATAAVAASSPVVTPEPVLPIGHVGQWLTDDAGRVIDLHGVNYVTKEQGLTPNGAGFDDDDAQWLIDNGFDVVRLGTTPASVMPTPGVVDHAYVDSFAATVDMLTSKGLLVLVDMHQDGWGRMADGVLLGDDGFPEWMTVTHGATNSHTSFPLYYITNPAIQASFQSLWDNDPGDGGTALQTWATQIWEALAAPVATNPGVLGYDLFNEPWPGTSWQPCATPPSGCPTQDAALNSYYAEAVAGLRSVGATQLAFGEPYVLFNYGLAPTTMSLPGGDPNAGMAYHSYPLDPAKEPAVVNFAQQWSDDTGGALLVTEFGATNDPATIVRQVDVLDDAMQPWIWWYYTRLVLDPTAPPTGTNLNPATIGALVRPHPLAVAGTPTALHFDESASTLDFAYSTTSPTGATLPCGTVTSIQTSPTAYPDGYHVEVTGGVVTSPPDAPQLTIVARPDAAEVTVRVSPGGSTEPESTSGLCTGATTISSTTSSTTVPPTSTTTPAVSPPAVAQPAKPTFTG